MKLLKYRIQFDKLPIPQIFMAGILVGIIGMSLCKNILLEHTGILEEYTLYYMKYMEMNYGAFFYYVLKKRLGGMIILIVLSTTYLGLFLCMGTAFWFGASAGAVLTVAILRYGIKGILLYVISLFPQCIIYIPAFFLLLVWCENLCRGIYYQKRFCNEKGIALFKTIHPNKLFISILLLLLGCILESFVNPTILLQFLKIF